MLRPSATSLALALALLATLTPAPARGQEREEILSYRVVVSLEAGGWMEVKEEIQVRALGEEIRRGIYRDFPTSFPRQSGLGRVKAPFQVLEVLKDGRPEPYITQSIGGPARRGGIRVRIGRENLFLDPGVYTYTLTYRTARWMEFGDDTDRLFWNVTGHGWDFVIREASARINLPAPVEPEAVELAGWTGQEGSQESHLTFGLEEGGRAATFRTTLLLGAQEGLTVGIALPKGIVPPPTEEDMEAWFRMDWGHVLEAGLVVALVLSVYLLMWISVGRDPPEGTLVIRYEPPKGFSAAAVGYVEERGWRASQLTAALVAMAVKGALGIEQKGRKWILRRREKNPASLSPEEEKLFRSLFSRGSRAITLSGTSHPTLRKAVKDFRRALKRKLESHYFVTNRRWFLAGLGVTLLGFGVLVLRARFSIAPGGWFLAIWLTFWSMGTGTLLTRVYHEWSQALSGDALSWVTAIFLSLFSLPFVAALLFVGYLGYQAVPLHLVIAAALLGLINVLFYHLLERPTLKGRGLLDEIHGFKSFLSATESDRLDRLQPRDKSLELFESFLPFAMALGVENAWAQRFEGVLDGALLAQAQGGGGAGESLSWISGGKGSSLSGLTTSLGGSFSSSLSASSAAPSSSGGGGGGGGSSGGGGGGGGGGGW